MAMLEKLRPEVKAKVIDCVQAAGLDVSDWANGSGGAARAAMNPKYCYNWSFIQPDRGVVLNLWYDHLVARSGGIETDIDARRSAKRHARRGGKAVWQKRATALDEAVAAAAKHGVPVRAIINDGRRRTSDSPTAKASQVTARVLDPVPWFVASYSERTGRGILRRGDVARETVDQFILGGAENTVAERRPTNGEAFIRDAEVRRKAIARSRGRCEYCDEFGFLTSRGEFYLETHHVVPLGEGGADRLSNVAAVCPNCHREAHYGARAHHIREMLLGKLQSL